jgi:hypothetical protein
MEKQRWQKLPSLLGASLNLGFVLLWKNILRVAFLTQLYVSAYVPTALFRKGRKEICRRIRCLPVVQGSGLMVHKVISTCIAFD